MSDANKNEDADNVNEVAVTLRHLGLSEDTISKIQDLGVDTASDLSNLKESDLVEIGLPVIKARKVLQQITPPEEAVYAMGPDMLEGLLPTIQDDTSWLAALKTGGVLKVDQSTVVAAIKAALAKQVGLYDIPSRLSSAMERFADESEEQVDTIFYTIRNQMTRRNYAEVFSAIEGLDGSFVTEERKANLLNRLDEYLWPSIASFNKQLKSWQEDWMQGAHNPAILMMAAAGGRGTLPPGIMQAPDTAMLRDATDTVNDSINKVFAGTGIQIAAALAYEASEIKKTLDDQRLPSLMGVTSREQLLRKLDVDVPATYPRLEMNVTKYVLAIMSFNSQVAGGNEELSYLGALYTLGAQNKKIV